MMNRFSLSVFLIVSLLTGALPLSAQQVTEIAAKGIALDFFTNQRDHNVSHAPKIQRKKPQLSLAMRRDELYVFNDVANGGYVVVSGDERVQPILGYSDANIFDEKSIPSNMLAWLESYAKQIQWMKNHHPSTVMKTLSEPSISPLLGDIEWGQSNPYNLLCPEIDGVRCPTGCIATAMAQVMCYHQWPTTTVEIPGYATDSVSISTMPAEDINWDLIVHHYTGKESQAQKEAIAKLMAKCGSAVQMEYGKQSSSANSNSIPSAMKTYFDYSNSIERIDRSAYDNDEWNQIIYNELSAGRPVIYGGLDLHDSGHGFVVDGYDKDNYFHINWGWNGSWNGNFMLALLDPESDGMGYNYKQEAIIGIKKSEFNEEGLKDGDSFMITTEGGKDITFEIISVSDKTCKVASVSQEIDGTVIIPVIAKGFTVVEIGASAFEECNYLKKIVMPSTIKKIGHDAFLYCRNLESADIPSGVKTIEYQAFTGCNSLTSIVVPDGITELPYNVFTGTGITSIVPKGSASTTNCAIIPNSVTRIVGSAFACCNNLESVILPAGVEEIGGNLACFSFGNPFVGCNNLKSLQVEKGNPRYHAEGNCIIETETSCVSVGCNYSVIPSYIKHIGLEAFANLNFEKFTVPEGVLSVEESAFNNSNCLKEVTLPSTLTAIDDAAFYICWTLKTLRVKMDTPILIDQFFKKTGLETLYVPVGTRDLYSSAYGWSEFKNIIEMGTMPILANRTIDFRSALDQKSDLDAAIIDNVYYNFANTQNGGYNYYDSCLEIRTNSDFLNESTEEQDLFDETFREQFTGIVLKVPAGRGTVSVKASAQGNLRPAIKVGNDKPTVLQQDGELAEIPYNVEDGTNVYIYGVSNDQNNCKAMKASTNDIIKVFEIGLEIASINKYKLTYMVDGEEYKSYEMEYGSTITPIEEPQKEGYVFTGWKDVPKTMPAHNVVIEGSFTTTDINHVMSEGKDHMVYTLEGTRVNSLQKGINLLKTKNGKTKKILVK